MGGFLGNDFKWGVPPPSSKQYVIFFVKNTTFLFFFFNYWVKNQVIRKWGGGRNDFKLGDPPPPEKNPSIFGLIINAGGTVLCVEKQYCAAMMLG